MAKEEPKTQANQASVEAFVAAVPDERRRGEAQTIDALHRRLTGCEPQMWGPSIIGYGAYSYRYESGREGTSCRAGFSPRKAAIVEGATLLPVRGFSEGTFSIVIVKRTVSASTVMVWVVDTGMPNAVARKSVTAPPVSAQNPPTGLSLVMR